MRIIAFCYLLVLSGFVQVSAQGSPDPRMAVHLLDYIAADYAMAVDGGEVINAYEFDEMVEFAATVEGLLLSIATENPSAGYDSLLAQAKRLKDGISDYQSADVIARVAYEMKNKVIALGNIPTGPARWPNLENGEALYATQCQLCHGARGHGDGTAAPGLDPAPTPFASQSVMGEKSPLQSYHTIKYGIDGTAMAGYPHLTENQLWDLAFFLHSLRFQDESQSRNSAASHQTLSLHDLASKGDKELLKVHDWLDMNALAHWRTRQGAPGQAAGPLDVARKKMEESLALAKAGEYDKAKSAALLAYLDGIEPIEVILKAQDPAVVQQLELEMGAYRKMIDRRRDASELAAQAARIFRLIDQAQDLMDNKVSSFWLTFIMAGSIILREGIEAFLIIIIILSVLKKANAVKAAKYIHAGWILAVALGFAGWIFADRLMNMSSMGREVMEGAAALVAVAVLFYLGIWMHGLTEVEKWNQFVKDKIHRLLDARSAIGLAALSFMVVFREAFESVLFLSAIGIDAQGQDNDALGLGVLVAFLLVGVLALAVMRFSTRLPISQLFRYSSYLLAILAVVLAGKGIHALQEAGYVGISAWPYSWRSEWLGVYPTIETMVAQLAVAAAVVATRIVQNRGNIPKKGNFSAA